MPSIRSRAARRQPGRRLRACGDGGTVSNGVRPRLLLLLALPTVAGASLAVGAAPTATAATGSPAAVASTTLTRPTLRYGDHGPDVVYLQEQLTALHYDVGSIDGNFGSSTLHGVYAFQKVQRIAVDGIVGPTAWGRLAGPYVPRARHYHSAASVEIDLSRRVVYLAKAGAVTQVIDSSPGKPSTPTPTGTFSITRRANAWVTSPLGRLWRPNYFYRGYALHGSNSVPTYAASHGCVRVTVPAMNRAWSRLYVGERLYVYK